MLALLFLIGSALLGSAIVRRAAGGLLSHAEQALWGLVTGWALTTAVGYALARTLGKLTVGSILALTCAAWIASFILWLPTLKRLRRLRFRSLWRPEYGALCLLVLLFAPVYLELFRTRMLQRGAGGLYSGGGSTWFDLNLHMAITTSFLYGQNYPPIYTPFPPGPLLYPFLPDFQTAMLVRAGLDFQAALTTTGVLLALAITGLFYSLALRIISQIFAQRQARHQLSPAQDSKAGGEPLGRRAPAGAALATLLFLFNGGLGVLYFFSDWRSGGKGLIDFWSHLETNYTNMSGRGIHWTNLINDGLIPQRPLLYGLAITLICCTLFAVVWGEWHEDETRPQWDGWRRLLPAGLLAGTLPYFHPHSYIAVCFISGALFILRPRRVWLIFWAPALLLALPQILNLTAHVGQGFMRFQPGWREPFAASWPLFWFRNIGVPLLVIIPAWASAPRRWRLFYLAFVFLLIFSLLVVVSPNDYDNIKLMYYWYGATCILIGAWLVKLASVYKQRLLASLLFIASILSGVLAIQSERLSRKLLFSDEEVAVAAFVRDRTAPRALFLTAPAFNQPVLSLAGRPVVRANTDWLWSHGCEFREREADVKSIYAGSVEALELLRYYGVEYVYLGQREREDLGADQSFFDKNFPVLYHGANITIYDTRRLLGEVRGHDDPARLPAEVAPREFASRVGKDPYQLLVEFPATSYAVYCYYKTSFGRMPMYQEFIEDMRVVGRGLYTGAPGWEEILENNKAALLKAWTERADFKALYDGSSNERYVDALYANAGRVPSASERARVVAALNGGAETRAEALRRVAESGRLERREYNAAYLLMHYFGYLRRNPFDLPDGNFEGFNFWLGQLNQNGDYRSVSRAFIESGEYKDQIGRRGGGAQRADN